MQRAQNSEFSQYLYVDCRLNCMDKNYLAYGGTSSRVRASQSGLTEKIRRI
jgi:hypothetical protein